MTEIFGHRWKSQYGDAVDENGELTSQAATWARGLALLTHNQIAAGLARCVEDAKRKRQIDDAAEIWPPSLPEFAAMCEPKAEDLGIPPVEAAFREAVNVAGRWANVTYTEGGPVSLWDRHQWSHPVVYHAAKEVGANALRELQRDKSFRMFDAAYAVLVRRAMAGEELSAPVPLALPRTVHVRTPAKARAGLAAAKAALTGRS